MTPEEQLVRSLVKVELYDHQIKALEGLLQSIGEVEFKKSMLLHLINKRQNLLAAQQFDEYIYLPNGKKDRELVRDRMQEKADFLRPIVVVNNKGVKK